MASLQLHLQVGEVIRAQQRSRIRVLTGRLWLTRAGDAEDHFMEAGDDAQLMPEDAPLMEAVNGGVLMSLEILDTSYRIY
jgi:Protein of unknown function (DUF2917)